MPLPPVRLKPPAQTTEALGVTSSGASSASVVIHCGHLVRGPRLDRRLRNVVRAVPRDVEIIATFTEPTEVHPRLARRVRSVVIDDGGSALFDHLFTIDKLFTVIPSAASVGDGWWAAVTQRASRSPRVLGVHPCGDEYLFVCPPLTTSLESPRALWRDLPGVQVTHPSTAGKLTAPGPSTLSAVYIVKDEEQVLGASLESVLGVADEVIVYDTGSSDGTRAIASRKGVTFITGFWDDDFAAARNRALAHATSDWVLSIDADEVLETDASQLASWLERTDASQSLVRITNTAFENGQNGVESRTIRLFRRQGAEWRGALHEQIWYSDKSDRSIAPDIPPLMLIHTGYTRSAFTRKAGRNTRIAEAALAKSTDTDAGRQDLLSHLVRSLIADGDVEAGLQASRSLLEEPATAGNMIQMCRALVPLLLHRGDLPLARRWAAIAKELGESSSQYAVWESAALSAEGRLEEAESLLRPISFDKNVEPDVDYWGAAFSSTVADSALAEIEHHLGRHEEAADRIVGVLQRDPENIHLEAMFDILKAANWTVGDLISVAPSRFIDRSLREMLLVDTSTALTWFAALIDALPGDPRPIIAGNFAAARSGWRDAVEWSTHARGAGVSDVCALRMQADDPDRSVSERALALAFMAEGFSDSVALSELATLLSSTDRITADNALSHLKTVVPTVLPSLVEA